MSSNPITNIIYKLLTKCELNFVDDSEFGGLFFKLSDGICPDGARIEFLIGLAENNLLEMSDLGYKGRFEF